jgi:hypothetical protein
MGSKLRYIRNTSRDRVMVATKVATLNLRIDPALKEAVRIAALRDRRSIANLIEVLIRQHCVKHGISIPEQHDLSLGSDDE